MEQPNVKNVYLEQVKAEQQQIEADLKAKRAFAPAQAMAAPASRGRLAPGEATATGGGDFQAALNALAQAESSGPALDIRVTGYWRWKTVIVPPNAYVVHTRRGHAEPLHIGLGVSFGFNPYTDSFLAVPSAMQTILINAHCICRELQGLLVQGYVQWIIADFATAYKKLDFTDAVDPMRVVNVQLREQAEAAIKDKVATMSIHDVLSDKQPIIEELTARLRQVAEGEGDGDKGLGLRIVTVQIKEAIVSSARLWENLQEPFRAEQARIARLAKLEAEAVVQARELEQSGVREQAALESESRLAALRAAKQAEVFDRDQIERARRHQKEQEVARQSVVERNATAKLEQQAKRELEEAAAAHAQAMARVNADLEKAKLAAETELARQRQDAELARKEIELKAKLATKDAEFAVSDRHAKVEIENEAARRQVLDELSSAHLQSKLIASLPGIVANLPKPAELRTISIGGGDQGMQSLAGLIAQVVGILDAFRVQGGKETSRGE